MIKRKMIVILAMCALLSALVATAEGQLSGWIEGTTLVVAWQVPVGNCELTVSQGDWPIFVKNVNGGTGSLSLPLSDAAGRFKLRLKTDSGCWTAEVKGFAPTARPTEVPNQAPTSKPTCAPTEAPTAVPTEAPTAVPTEAPTAAPTAVPTEAPTAVPTEAPTAVPTAVPTARPTRKPLATATPTARPTQKPAATPTARAPQLDVTNRDDLASQVVAQVNAERAKQGLNALRVDGELTRAACVRAGEITQKFSHTRPDGSKWSTVSASAYAENIARGQNTADKVMAAWMSSSTGHRENILRPSYGSIGVCAYSYNGVMYWVQLFGK